MALSRRNLEEGLELLRELYEARRLRDASQAQVREWHQQVKDFSQRAGNNGPLEYALRDVVDENARSIESYKLHNLILAFRGRIAEIGENRQDPAGFK